MAKIEDLIAQIADERLRNGLSAEVKALKRTKKFGLVFEEHLPETVRLPRLPIRAGELVALKREPGNQRWRVRSVSDGVASCHLAVESYPDEGERKKEFRTSDLVVVRNFGESIYPALVPVNRIERGGPAKPWHLLISADNFHALQLLLYCYEGKVDVIYIDPPYNTGARDWKYNNDYVDKSDSFRHSKWLSMLKRRLLLAKRLLKPSGIMVVTIDEHEVHNLGALLAEHLPEFNRQMVTIVINQKGVAQGKLSRVEEYAFFCFGPEATIPAQDDDLLVPESTKEKKASTPRWERLLRGGPDSKRTDSPNLFYPVLVDPETRTITGVGAPLAPGQKPQIPADRSMAWPIRTDGSEGRWRTSAETLRNLIAKGFAKLGGYDLTRKTWTVLYLGKKAQRQIESGAISVLARDPDTGAVSLGYTEGEQRQIKTVWHRASHDSGIHGSSVLRTFLGESGTFAFPKSLYAVRDTLRVTTSDKPDALILDFFAGSGTTLHATALLNAELGGTRRCILVTNNEVAEKAEQALAAKGHFPGDEEFENQGVASSVTWPRCQAAITGRRADGEIVPGDYLNGRSMQEGFEENLESMRLDFLDPNEVARGDAFQAILPMLWMMAECRGKRENAKGAQPWFLPKNSPFAVLLRERDFRAFRNELEKRPDIKKVFLVTDSEENFAAMRRWLGRKLPCIQLYKNYLENFRLNTPEALTREGEA